MRRLCAKTIVLIVMVIFLAFAFACGGGPRVVAPGEETNDHATPTLEPSPSPNAENENASASASPDPRVRWMNTSYDTTVYHVKGTKWEERENKTGKVKWSLEERDRTPEFIEMFNPVRKITYRFSARRLHKVSDNGQASWLSNGYWMEKENSPASQANPVAKVKTPPQSPPSPPRQVSAGKWYQGGTLHSKGALDWQRASRHDKVATCGDFITKMWQDGKLTPEISRNIATVDDVRLYAEKLADGLDAAFKKDPDPELNRRLFANQAVSGTGVILMITMKWLK